MPSLSMFKSASVGKAVDHQSGIPLPSQLLLSILMAYRINRTS